MDHQNAGCKNALPLPNHAIIVYISQLECCKGAYNGQISNACIKGLPNPPTSMPTIAPTAVAPTTKLPTTLAGLGGGWYADYGTTWPNAGCKKPPHCQSMPPCSTPLSWRAVRVHSEDRRVMHVLWDFLALPRRSLPQPQPRSPLHLPFEISIGQRVGRGIRGISTWGVYCVIVD